MGAFVATQGPPIGLLQLSLLPLPQESKAHPCLPLGALCPSWQPVNLREPPGWLMWPQPTSSAGRHTPFAELKAKREAAADTRLETEQTPASMPSLRHSASRLKLSEGPQEPPPHTLHLGCEAGPRGAGWVPWQLCPSPASPVLSGPWFPCNLAALQPLVSLQL